MAGMAAAISAARDGSKVVLMHERPFLGGNALSEYVCGYAVHRAVTIVKQVY